MFENNPVGAAYGVWRSLLCDDGYGDVAVGGEASGAADRGAAPWIALEWDVYLDPALVKRWRDAVRDGDEAGATTTAREFVHSMVIAHGTPAHIVLEFILRTSQYSRVAATAPQKGGGVMLEAWLGTFTRSLVLASRHSRLDCGLSTAEVEDVLSGDADLRAVMAALYTVINHRRCAPHASASGDLSDDDAGRGQRRAKRPPPHIFEVMLDIKSMEADGQVLTAVVEHLNRLGVSVIGVGSFIPAKLVGLRHYTQRVWVPKPASTAVSRAVHRLAGTSAGDSNGGFAGGVDDDGTMSLSHARPHADDIVVVRSPPQEFRLLHLLGDLQSECWRGTVRAGDRLWCNGGALLSYSRVSTPRGAQASYHVTPGVLQELRDLKRRYGFHLGFYVQEPAADAVAVRLITDAVNQHSDVVDMGLGWGGLNGLVMPDVAPSLFMVSNGRGLQDLIGLPYWRGSGAFVCTGLGYVLCAVLVMVLGGVLWWVFGLDGASVAAGWRAVVALPGAVQRAPSLDV